MGFYESHNWDVKTLQTQTSGYTNPKVGTTVTDMGNDLADAIRAELRSALLSVYGTLEEAAESLGVPYKTLRRHLSRDSKDRTARVTLDFVIDTANHLSRVANVDLAEIYRRAQLRADVDDSDVSGAEDADAELRQRDHDLAARKRSKDRGEDTEHYDA